MDAPEPADVNFLQLRSGTQYATDPYYQKRHTFGRLEPEYTPMYINTEPSLLFTSALNLPLARPMQIPMPHPTSTQPVSSEGEARRNKRAAYPAFYEAGEFKQDEHDRKSTKFAKRNFEFLKEACEDLMASLTMFKQYQGQQKKSN